jgi:hypothetical protein
MKQDNDLPFLFDLIREKIAVLASEFRKNAAARKSEISNIKLFQQIIETKTGVRYRAAFNIGFI